MNAHPFRLEVINGALPAVFLLGVAVVIAIHSALRRRSDPAFYRWLGMEACVAVVLATLVEAYRTRFLMAGVFVSTGGRSPIASGALIIDRFSLFTAVLLAAVALVVCGLSGSLIKRIPSRSGAFHALLLTATAGGIVLAEQLEMVTLMSALGLLVVSIVGLACLDKPDPRALRGAYRAAITVGVSLALTAYGLVLLYGVSGSTSLALLSTSFDHAPVITSLGIGITTAGLVSLAGALPLRSWLLDLGDALPGVQLAAVAGIMVPAVLLATVRLTADAWASLPWWPEVVAGFGVLTAVVSALEALGERRVRQILIHALIGQIGVVVATVAAIGGSFAGLPSGAATAALVEVIALAIAFVAALGGLGVLEAAGAPAHMDMAQLRGVMPRLGRIGGVVVLCINAVSALPPFGLFIGELLGVAALLTAGLVWAAVLVLIATALISMVALRMTAAALADPPLGAPPLRAIAAVPAQLLLGFCSLAGVLSMIFAGTLVTLAANASGVLAGH